MEQKGRVLTEVIMGCGPEGIARGWRLVGEGIKRYRTSRSREKLSAEGGRTKLELRLAQYKWDCDGEGSGIRLTPKRNKRGAR